jgi:4-hydroxy-3-methylbut-2-enyl diphosphate reductase
VRTYHIADPACLVGPDRIRHRPIGAPSTTSAPEIETEGWLPTAGHVTVGLTAGASTPNNIVGEVMETLSRFAQ